MAKSKSSKKVSAKASKPNVSVKKAKKKPMKMGHGDGTLFSAKAKILFVKK